LILIGQVIKVVFIVKEFFDRSILKQNEPHCLNERAMVSLALLNQVYAQNISETAPLKKIEIAGFFMAAILNWWSEIRHGIIRT